MLSYLLYAYKRIKKKRTRTKESAFAYYHSSHTNKTVGKKRKRTIKKKKERKGVWGSIAYSSIVWSVLNMPVRSDVLLLKRSYLYTKNVIYGGNTR